MQQLLARHSVYITKKNYQKQTEGKKSRKLVFEGIYDVLFYIVLQFMRFKTKKASDYGLMDESYEILKL